MSPSSASPSTSVLTRSASSAGSLSACEQGDRPLAAEPVPPHLDDPLRVGVADRRAGRVLVARQLDALALDAAQDGVDHPVPGARLGELDGLRDRRVVGDAVHEQQLLEPDVERRADAVVEPAALGEALEDPVVRAAALHGAEREPLGERPVARVEAARRSVERAVGVRAAGSVRRTTSYAARRAGLALTRFPAAPRRRRRGRARSPRRTSAARRAAAPRRARARPSAPRRARRTPR